MNRFTPLLKRINDRLDVAQPLKSQIMLELAGDLNEAFEYYRNKGMSEEEAEQKAAEKFDLADDAALSDLVRIHQPVFMKFMNKISAQAQTAWERVILGLILAVIVLLNVRPLIKEEFFMQSSIFVLPVLTAGCVVLAIFIVKFYRLYVKKDHNTKTLRRGLNVMLYCIIFILCSGAFGYYWELTSLGWVGMLVESKLILLITTSEPVTMSRDVIFDCMIRTTSLILTSMIAIVFTGIFWFLLNNKVVGIEQAEAEGLLEK